MLGWQKKRQQKSLPTEPVEYPIGSFVETEKGYFYISAATKRYRITTLRCLQSHSPQRVVKTSEAAVEKYRVAAKLKFRNGSLIHSVADGKVYYISEGKRRHLVSPEAFEKVGAVDRLDATSVSIAEINLHPEGAPLN